MTDDDMAVFDVGVYGKGCPACGVWSFWESSPEGVMYNISRCPSCGAKYPPPGPSLVVTAVDHEARTVTLGLEDD